MLELDIVLDAAESPYRNPQSKYKDEKVKENLDVSQR